MRKSEFSGWTNVFRFTFVENWKTRSFLIYVCIMWAICFLSIPVMALITASKDSAGEVEYEIEKVHIEKAYVLDEAQFTAMGFDAEAFKKVDEFKEIPVERVSNRSYDEMKDVVDADPKAILVHIGMDMTHGVAFNIVRAIESEVTETECDYIGSLLLKEFDTFKYEAADMGEEQLKALESGYEVVALMEQEDGEFISEKAHLSETKFWIVYVVLFAVMLITTIASAPVATAVAMDKSTKVMEYLLTSIRPMALVLGKIVAQVVSTIIQLGGSLLLLFLSNLLTSKLFGMDYLKEKIPTDVFENITVLNILISLVAIALGVMLFSFIAGLCGAMVSKLEELPETQSVLTILTILGCYLAMFAALNMQKNLNSPLVKVAMLVPLSSPFLLPGVCIIGVGAWWMKLVSLGILLVLNILILVASARIYEMLIFYNGATIKPKELIKFLKSARGGKTA